MDNFDSITKSLRYHILTMTTNAGSGHPTSSLSAVELMATLFFQYLSYDFKNPHNKHNDRVIFSKGHATPLLYSLYKIAGEITENDLKGYRSLESNLQGHPTPEIPFIDVATGSLGMGLSFGVGMAMASQIDQLKNKIYVLLGDGEMAEGSVWESIELAAHYRLNNLIGIIDVNRLGETGETMIGHDVEVYAKRIAAFGWKTIVIDGHDYEKICDAYIQANIESHQPTMIIAKTVKGKGISFLENKEGRHGKPLSTEEYEKAIQELGISDEEKNITAKVHKPDKNEPITETFEKADISAVLSSLQSSDEIVPVRKAFGQTLALIAEQKKNVIAIDGDLSDATFSGLVQKNSPDQFFNMFIAEQNMIGAAVGLSKMGKTTFASTFAAFHTRAFDQIRMAALSEANIKIVGSHAGVSIGADGASQMGLEDIAMMRSVFGSTILYPADSISASYLTNEALGQKGIVYIRTTRQPLPRIYDQSEIFKIGDVKVIHESDSDQLLLVCAGITLHEGLKAYESLKNIGINIRIIDCYSIKPIPIDKIKSNAQKSNNTVLVVEDHYFEGGLGDAVLNVFATERETVVHKLAITERPHSGKPEQLISRFGIDSNLIENKIKSILSSH